jgi:peptidoglycan/LPS O-acetylase OafA/YrhL
MIAERVPVTVASSHAVGTGGEKSRLYLPQLDGLRFFAFLLVYFHHYWPADHFFQRGFFQRNFSLAQDFGWVGVDIFLTLSAFLIFTLLLKETEKTGTVTIRLFYLRRALRIWPLYYPYLIIAFLVPYVFSEPDYNLATAARYHLGPALVFLLNFSYPKFWETVPFTIGHLWTISLEEQFYVFAPVVVFFCAAAPARRIGAVMLALFALTIGARTYEMFNSPPYLAAWVSPLCRLDPLLAGAALAFIHHRQPTLFTRWRGEWFAVAAIALFVLITHYPNVHMSRHTIWQLSADALGSGCLIVAMLARGWIGRAFSCHPLPFFGKISFGLYVYHEVLLHYSPVFFPHIVTIFTPANWAIGFTEVLGLTILIGAASYLLYERHFLKLKRRFEIVHARPV